MENILSRRSVVFGFLLVAFVVAFEFILGKLNLPAWPAFMVMIFFFIAHEDAKQAPHIVIGGLAGIFCVVLLKSFMPATEPIVGAEAAKLIFVGLFVYAIVLFTEAIPYLFNSYAFMFFLVSALAFRLPEPAPYTWMAVEFVVGTIFIVGIIGINRVTAMILNEQGQTTVDDYS
ncbi:MAG: hypothetical protein PHY31_02660 [Smithellaceae bacterium]|nr:hypothetical protein [Smithellaceae bacterium]